VVEFLPLDCWFEFGNARPGHVREEMFKDFANAVVVASTVSNKWK
jgi:hypothetical protein